MAKKPRKRQTNRSSVQQIDTGGLGAQLRHPDASGLGAQLRRARERAGVSVRELARSVGVSPSLVSQVERGRVTPSVGTLYAVVNELGLSIDALFKGAIEAPPGRDPPGTKLQTPVQSAGDRQTIRLSGGVRWERLSSTPDDQLEFLYVVYEAGASSCHEDALIRHGGKEYAFLLSGRLGIRIGFDVFELAPGDSISFDAQSPHRLWTIGSEPAVAVWVVLDRHGDTRRRVPKDAPAR